MNWLHPALLIALLAVPFTVALFVWATVQRTRALGRLGRHPLVQELARAVSPRRRRWQAAFAVMGVGLVGLALAGPRFGTTLREIEREGIDLVILLDVSASMVAEDVAPSRLEKAKQEIRLLLDELDGDRVGLVLFAGDAFLQCPLTLDYSAVRLFLDVATPEAIPTPGTDFARALDTALRALEPDDNSLSTRRRSAALLLVSDGENHDDPPETQLEALRTLGVPLFAAGIGLSEGAPIPVYQDGRRVGFKRDADGGLVQTRLEAESLRRLGSERYVQIARTGRTLPALADDFDRLERTSFGQEIYQDYVERFQWPLALALLFLTAGFLFLPERRAATDD